MWDLLIRSPLGRTSQRNILTFVIALSMALFSVLSLSQPAAAATDVTWNAQGQPVYKNNSYAGPMGGSSTQSLPSVVPSDAEAAYQYTPDSGSAAIIYFPKGSDPKKATEAQFITAKMDGSTYSDPSPPTKVSVAPQPASTSTDSSSNNTATANENKGSTCNVTGIGWIICPVSEKLATGMDYLFKVLTDFLKVAPLSGDTGTVIYKGWNYMRSFANIALIIGFLIIIYSQVTNYGISNYGIKRLLPRLIIAAVLMNISYWICALAIDLSNVIAISMHDLFMTLYNQILHAKGTTTNIPTWQTLTAAALAGTGTVAGVGIVAASSGGILALLVPTLVAVSLSAMVAVVVLAARQAIIVILTMVAPLAFVAYLLPNTEKYFHKWREYFTTMMMIFPIFACLFGGAQLAGAAIMQTAGQNIVVLLLGMAVQVVPVAITPFLLKFSGGLLGKVAGIVNNPNKGLVDRSRNWANGAKERQTVRGAAYNRFGAAAIARKEGKAARDDNFKKRRANIYAESTRGRRDAVAAHQIEREAERIKGQTEIAIQAHIAADPSELEKEFRARTVKIQAELEKAKVDNMYNEIRAGVAPMHAAGIQGPLTKEWQSLMDDTTAATQGLAVESMRKRMAERVEKREFANEMSRQDDQGVALRQAAGGIDDSGEIIAESFALSEIVKQNKESRDANIQRMSQQALSQGRTVKQHMSTIAENNIKGIGPQAPKADVEAAFEFLAGTEGDMLKFEQARLSNNVDQKMLDEVISRNVPAFKQKGGFHLQANFDLADGKKDGNWEKMNAGRTNTLADTAASNIKDLKAGWFDEVSKNIDKVLNDAVKSDPGKAHAEMQRIINSVDQALEVPDIASTIGDRRPAVERVRKELRNRGYTPTWQQNP